MGPEEHGGYCELEFDGLEIPREELLMAKIQVANLLHRAADTAIQINGAAAIRPPRCSNGPTAMPGRRGLSTGPTRCTPLR